MIPQIVFAVELAAMLCGGGPRQDEPTQPTPVPPGIVDSEGALVQLVAWAYRKQDYEVYETLFANEDDHGVDFVFVLSGPTVKGETQWGYDEEMRIHRRMFRPDEIPAGERQVPGDLWIESVECKLTPLRSFRERYDLYRSDMNPVGLDRKRWRASDADYVTYLHITTSGGRLLHVEGHANFVVIEDRFKLIGEDGKFLIYRWEDERTTGT